jgi:diguanylate cyclase (GGDEF)-like protein/PAS domain S-box-containing protein
MIYLVSVILESRDATEFRLQEMASIHSMVTDNSRDVILLADLDGRRTYVSPAVVDMNGWKPEDLVHQKLSAQTHPEDLEKVEAAIERIRRDAKGVILEYRTQKRNGGYIWVESTLRLFRDRRTRIPAGILSMVRDISERKHSEALLLKAYEALEELAVSDALTGVANRRRFDEYLAGVWNRSVRLRKPISLLLIDADSFKQHNDTYGHLAGDRWLRQISEAATIAAQRPEDLVARFGGDEFAVIMPETDNQGALAVGSRIREILHRRNSMLNGETEGLVTISIGCGTVVPNPGDDAEVLIQMADEALYEAKRNGRDRMCTGSESLPIASASGRHQRPAV